MLPNGLLVTLDLAVDPRLLETTEGRARYLALVAGLFREDVWWARGLPVAAPAASFSHVWPYSLRRCAVLIERALGEAETDVLRSSYLVGRAVHVLADMACPAHARAKWHGMADSFERYVDAHASELAALPLPAEPQGSVRELVSSLAHAAQGWREDPTCGPLGRPLQRLGLLRPLATEEVARQARALIPLAGAHVRAMLRFFDRGCPPGIAPLAPVP